MEGALKKNHLAVNERACLTLSLPGYPVNQRQDNGSSIDILSEYCLTVSMQIETKRLVIRPWQKNDVPHYLKLSTDVGYNCFCPPGVFLVKDEAEAQEKINQRMTAFEENKCGKYPVFLKDGGQFIGTCGFSPYEINGQKEIELGYRLLLEHWGRGYATEAAAAAIANAFDTLGKERVFAFAIKQNPASLQIIKKLGFVYQSLLVHAGLEHDLFVMAKGEHLGGTA